MVLALNGQVPNPRPGNDLRAVEIAKRYLANAPVLLIRFTPAQTSQWSVECQRRRLNPKNLIWRNSSPMSKFSPNPGYKYTHPGR
jgi:hypothetical protein